MNRRTFVTRVLAATSGLLAGCSVSGEHSVGEPAVTRSSFEVIKSDAEWRRILSEDRYQVLRKHDTERPGSSPLNAEHREGVYQCAGCDLDLFRSDAKFDRRTGWPSFTQAIPNAIGTSIDRSPFGVRTEVHCRRCGGHLGHVFADGPPPTGQRYCMNGAALVFEPKGVPS